MPHDTAVAYRQIGRGVGNYEAATGHYNFNVAYQKIRRLPKGFLDHGGTRKITGWFEPGTSQAAVAGAAALD